MPWAAIASAVAPTIIGGLMGSEGSSQSQTQQNTIDPRMAKYIYGENGTGGLLSEANKWYENNKTGLNSQMLQGLNTQWNVLNNPETMGTYKQMQNIGSSLMSAPVMGNPFANGQASLNSPPPMNLGMGCQRPQMQPMQPQMRQPMQQQMAPQYQSFTNPGAGQQYTPQNPFVQPEWVSKPQPVAAAPVAKPVDPGEAERIRREEEAASMQRRM